LAIAVTAGIGWVVAGVALRPVDAMRVEAEQMSADDLHRRLVVPGTRDELSRLADTLNSLLAEIDAALTRERAFIGQASHEMRTPLANLKAEVDLALRRPRDHAELRTALLSIGEEVDRLSGLANDLLDLARLGQGQWALRLEDVDPHELVSEEVRRASARAASDHLDLQVDCRTVGVTSEVRADPQRLRQVISNLLDNAMSNSPGGGSVVVTSELSDGWTLRVVDEGPGFPSGDLASLTRPFGSGATHGPGSTGLGLSIVSAIVEAHGGSLQLDNEAVDGTTRGAVAVVHIR
jgi:signal transduction histidine kinase